VARRPGVDVSDLRNEVGSVNHLYPPKHPQGRADRHGHDLSQRTLWEFVDGTNDDPDPSLARNRS